MKDGKVVILVVDDSFPDWNWEWTHEPLGEIEVVSTMELEEGRRLFQERKDEIDIIVIDHQVIGGTTPELIREIKASGYNGKLIGVTYAGPKSLEDAGCDYVSDRKRLFHDRELDIGGYLEDEIEKVRRVE
jgi:response regulator RpfG family c-di-GMP phosphodiesterase